MIGIQYEWGLAVEINKEKALSWFLKAAKEKHPASTRRVGDFYADGIVKEQDYIKAKEWYLKGILGGCSDVFFVCQAYVCSI